MEEFEAPINDGDEIMIDDDDDDDQKPLYSEEAVIPYPNMPPEPKIPSGSTTREEAARYLLNLVYTNAFGVVVDFTLHNKGNENGVFLNTLKETVIPVSILSQYLKYELESLSTQTQISGEEISMSDDNNNNNDKKKNSRIYFELNEENRILLYNGVTSSHIRLIIHSSPNMVLHLLGIKIEMPPEMEATINEKGKRKPNQSDWEEAKGKDIKTYSRKKKKQQQYSDNVISIKTESEDKEFEATYNIYERMLKSNTKIEEKELGLKSIYIKLSVGKIIDILLSKLVKVN